jgi:hypothetical protein
LAQGVEPCPEKQKKRGSRAKVYQRAHRSHHTVPAEGHARSSVRGPGARPQNCISGLVLGGEAVLRIDRFIVWSVVVGAEQKAPRACSRLMQFES